LYFSSLSATFFISCLTSFTHVESSETSWHEPSDPLSYFGLLDKVHYLQVRCLMNLF
jgi:hypothetical protein